MCYRFTSDSRYLDHATAIADWWLSLPNMPSDRIPFWDMKAPGTDVADNPEVPRDASAAALIASALYELAEYVIRHIGVEMWYVRLGVRGLSGCEVPEDVS